MEAIHALTDADIAAHDSGGKPLTDADISAHDALPQQSGLWDSFKAVLPHPIDALREWAGRGAEIGKGMDALAVYDKIAAENPANKGLPPGKQKMLREPTADEQAVIDRGMSAQMGTPEGNVLSDASAPGVTAAKQAGQGNLAGAAGTILGGYVAPAAAAAAIPYMVSPAARVVRAAVKAGGKDLAVGAAKTAAGYGVIHLDPAGEVGSALVGAPVLKSGLKQVGSGLKAGYAAGKDALFPPAAAPAPELAPNPYAAGVANASTNAPEALVTPPAPQGNAAQYATGTMPTPVQPQAAPAPVTPAPVTPAPVVEQPVATPPSPNAGYANEVADLVKANADAKDAKFADYLQHPDRAMTADQVRDMSIDDYRALHSDVPTGKTNAKTGKATKFTVTGDDSKLAARKDALESVMRTREANAASVKGALDLQAKGVTAKSISAADAPGSTPAQLQDLRFQLQKLEAGAAAKP
jgi:hypothetical protein